MIALWCRDGALERAPAIARGFSFVLHAAASSVRYLGSAVAIGKLHVLIYLPQGESVEARHLADVGRWLAEHGVSETS